VAAQAPVPPSTVFPPAPLSAPAAFAPPPQTPSPQEAPASQAGVASSPYEGRSEVSPPTAEPGPSQPVPVAQAAPVVPTPTQPASPGEEKRRGRLLGLVALVAVLLVGGAVIAFMLQDDTGPGGGVGQASAGATTEQALAARTTADLRPVGAFPDTVESLFLVAHIGADNIVSWNCRRGSTLEDAIRGVICSPGDGVSEASYSLFHDGFRMRNYFRDLQDSKGASAAGECVSPEPWRGFWSIGPETWAHALGSDKGDYRGQVLCFRSPTGEPHIAWIDYSTKIFAEATAPRGGEEPLYYWWRQLAGPGHPTHIHSIESGNTSAVQGENQVSGTIVAIGRDGVGNIMSATVRGAEGTDWEVSFDPNRAYDCSLVHVQEHKDSKTEVILPVEKVDGQLVVTYFTHC
ncbi:MAG TPA: hypothetical protein VFF07_05750, partial [Actinomycetota bacterium]|nr:hypothetical protein [Actinomycetota bacterium]